MRTRFILLSTLSSFWLILASSMASAQEDTAHHRKIYRETNEKQASYRKIVTTYTEEDPLIVDLTGYFDGSSLRKIVSRSGEDGEGYEEYYLENGKPLFVFSTYTAGAGREVVRIENRLYFKDGKLFKWLASDRKGPAAKEDAAAESERLVSNATAFSEALKKAAK